jgi:hypothetical protein
MTLKISKVNEYQVVLFQRNIVYVPTSPTGIFLQNILQYNGTCIGVRMLDVQVRDTRSIDHALLVLICGGFL